MLLEVAVGAARGVAAVEADRLVLPLAVEAEVAPGADVGLRATGAILGEDRVDLLEGEARERIVLVDEHGEHVDRAGHGRRGVAVLLLEGVDLRGFPVAAHGAERAGALGEGRGSRRRTLALDALAHPGIELLEALGPERYEVVHRVGADELERPADLTRHPLVGLEGGVEVLGRERGAGDEENGGERQETRAGERPQHER
jgi:hypothetical protein